MKKIWSTIVRATIITFTFNLALILVGCTSTKEKTELAYEIYDAEYFVVNTMDTIGGKGKSYQRAQTDDYVVYEIWYRKGGTKYWIDENGFGTTEQTYLKAKYSVADYIDYMFSWGKYREDDDIVYTPDSSVNIYNNYYYIDEPYDDDDYYDYDDYDGYYYDDDVYYYLDDSDYDYDFDDSDDYDYYYYD